MEDDEGYARLLKVRLERQGFRVELAYDGKEGLEKFGRNTYDVLILDYKMPCLNGIDVLKILKQEEEKNPPIIMVTGMSDVQIAVDAMKLGASDYVIKDSDINYLEILPSVIERAINHKKIQDEKLIAEEALRESEERFRSLFEYSNDAIFIHNPEGSVIEVNAKGCEMLHATLKQICASKMDDFFYVAKEEKEPRRFPDIMEMGSHIFEDRFKVEDGSVIDVEISSCVVSREKGIIQTIVRDITRKKRTEEELIEKNQELNDFTYIVSHDLKSPLNKIKGFLMLISENHNMFDELFPIVIKQSETLISFIDRLLELSRAGKVIDDKININLDYLVNKVFTIAKPPDISVQFSVNGSLPVISGDPIRMEQVFSNLFNNSISFRDPSKKTLVIEVGSKIYKNFALISVKDNGVGIKHEKLDRVFDICYTEGRKGGTGFGLTITKKVIEAHGGNIWADSHGENKGTTIFMKIPLPQE
ncbi:MAG: response regulator [Firmicutes bacterium]|nr:response regulator [Bacillota bacterium]